MFKCKINHKTVTVKAGTTIIEIADRLQIPIPRFCYHPELSVTSHCNMCLVEVTNSNKLLPACSTVVSEGMMIFTNTSEVIANQKAVISNLLNSHPLDCPICDQAGECELQNLSWRLGADRSEGLQSKRAFSNSNLELGPLIATNMSRCINCTRCVRFSEEIAGTNDLVMVEQNNSFNVTKHNSTIVSEIAGNMIDLCPVGALVAKPTLHQLRSWELYDKIGISSHDCIGSNISYHVDIHGEIKRAVPKFNPKINNIWLSDRDRFSFLGINSQDRLKYPLIKKNNIWCVATWEEVFEFIKIKLTKIIERYGANQIGGLITPNATLEEGWWFQYLLRNLGSNNIDHRLRQIDFQENPSKVCYPYLDLKAVAELKEQEVILLIGSYINKEQPIAAMYMRTAIRNNCKLIVVNPIDFDLNMLGIKLIPENADLMKILLQIAKAIMHVSGNEFLSAEICNLIKDLPLTDQYLEVAALLLNAKTKKVTIILGALARSYPEYFNLFSISNLIAKFINANFGVFAEGANNLGLYLMDCLPFRNTLEKSGLNTIEILQNCLKAYILFGIEPELDCACGSYAHDTLMQAELVISCTAFESDLLLKYSNVMLPIALPQESGGGYVNITGELQYFNPISKMPGESQSGVKIFKKLAEIFDLNTISIDLNAIINQKIMDFNKYYLSQKYNLDCYQFKTYNPNSLVKISPIGIYAVDPVVRRAKSLQDTLNCAFTVAINPINAQKLNILNNEEVYIKSIKLRVILNEQIPCGCILIDHINLNHIFGSPYQQLVIEKIKVKV